MIRLKNICLVVLMMVTFIRCTEIYTPSISSTAEALVVEGLITDSDGPFTIKLSKAVLFTSDSVSDLNYVLGAKLTISDNESHTYTLTDAGKGNYTLPSTFKAKIGNSYKLHIETKDGNIYESKTEKLLTPLTYDSIHAIHNTEEYLGQDNETRKVPGSDILVDLFKSVPAGDSIPLCRFSPIITVQFQYNRTVEDTIDWHWEYNNWQSFPLNANENITEDKALKSNALIKNHLVGFVPIGLGSYGITAFEDLTYCLYYLRIYQYTMNRDSYNFYKDANSQLAASGKIFDPVASQLYGNIKCINHPSKIALGLFEVSSITKTAFLVLHSAYSTSVLLEKVAYLDIPSSGITRFKVWTALGVPQPKDSAYISTMPSWWMHY